MLATVNKDCIGCGLCVSLCEEVFAMGDDGMAHGSEFNDTLLQTVREARDECPVSVIDIAE